MSHTRTLNKIFDLSEAIEYEDVVLKSKPQAKMNSMKDTKRKGQSGKAYQNDQGKTSKERKLECFECKSSEHVRANCPKLIRQAREN